MIKCHQTPSQSPDSLLPPPGLWPGCQAADAQLCHCPGESEAKSDL